MSHFWQDTYCFWWFITLSGIFKFIQIGHTFDACRLRSNVQSSDQTLSAPFLPSLITSFSCAVLIEPSLLFWFSTKNPLKVMSVNWPNPGSFFNFSNNRFPPGSFHCGQNCATCTVCPYITNGLTTYTFYATDETHSVTSQTTCNTRNVIYIVQSM